MLGQINLGLGLRAKLRDINAFAKNHFGMPSLYDLKTPERVGCIYREPSDMCATDRLMLYSIVRGLRPKSAIEIGVRWGGSARIITNAMEENKLGRLVGIDPDTESFRVSRQELHERYILVQGYSPEVIPAAVEKAGGGPLDFVFIDGMHIYDAVLKDFKGVLPYLADGAHVLLHDTYHQGIDQAVGEVLRSNSDLVDCGYITRNPTVGLPVSYQGLRLIRKGAVDSERIISEAYERNNQVAPKFSNEFWNRDVYYDTIKAKEAKAKA